MTVTEDDFDLAVGGIAGADAIKAEREARKAARGSTGWFGLADDGDMSIIRYLTPEPQWIRIKQHEFVKTKPAPADKPADRNWPEKVGATCRYTPRANGEPTDTYCYVCENIKNDRNKLHYPKWKFWALAAQRVSVIGDEELVRQGRIHESQIGQKLIIDDADEVDELDANGNTTGRKIWRKKIIVVNMDERNYFAALTTLVKLQGSCTDRDFAVVRKGKKGEIHSFDHVDLGSSQVTVPKLDGEGTEVINYDTSDPRIAKLYEGHGMTWDQMRRIIGRRLSKEYYGFYFDPRVSISWKDFYEKGGDGDSNASSSQAASPAQPSAEQQAGNVATAEPTTGVAADRMAEMRRQVLGDQGQAAPASAPPASPQQQEQAAPPPVAAPAPLPPA